MSDDEKHEPRPGGAYEKELLDHLSKEILSQSDHIMAFRTKVSFIVWLGPFIVVGAILVATKQVPTSFNPGHLGWACIILAAAFYFVLEEVLASIEIHMWDQGNKWRTLVVQINAGLSKPPSAEELEFKHDLNRGYRWVASVILMIFILLSIGAWQVIHESPPNQHTNQQPPASQS